MRVVLSLMLVCVFGFSGVFDFSHLKNAKNAYEKKEYIKAANEWGKVDSDEARYNRANALYKAKKYDEAIDEYKSIKDKNLAFKKAYNIGNSYAKMEKFDDAIESYKKALKIKDDINTKKNIQWAKNRKKEHEKKKREDKPKNQKNNKKSQNTNPQDKNSSKSGQKGDKRQQNSNQNRQNKNGADRKDKAKNNNEKDKSAQTAQTPRYKANKNEQKQKTDEKGKKGLMQKNDRFISDMEERKWRRELNKRGVSTLMLPLSKSDKKDENEKPW